MKKLLLLVSVVLLSIVCKAQSTVDKQVADKIAELRKTGIDTIVTYYRYCTGRIRVITASDTSCYGGDPRYILWVKNSECYVQKFDECRQHPIQNMAKEFLEVVACNYKKIEKEQIKPPTFDTVIKGKKQTMVTYIDHSCRSDFKFFILNTSFEKNIDDYYLETQYIDSKYPNKFYKSNLETKLYKLQIIIEAEIKRLNL